MTLPRLTLLILSLVFLSSTTEAAPIPTAGETRYELPTITIQTLPLEKMVADWKEYFKLLDGDRAEKRIEDKLKKMLGKYPPEGIDAKRSSLAYGYLRENLLEICGVIIIPTTSEKAGLAFLEILEIQYKPMKGAAGRYQLTMPDEGIPFAIYAQFMEEGKWLYIGINTPTDMLDKDKLIPPTKILDTTNRHHTSITLYPGRIPVHYRTLGMDYFEEMMKANVKELEQEKNPDFPKSVPALMKEVVKFSKQTSRAFFTECESMKIGLSYMGKSGNLELDLLITPKLNTPFARDIDAIKGPVGRFHQLTSPEAILGGWLMLPTPLPEGIRTTAGRVVSEAFEQDIAKLPEPLRPLMNRLREEFSKTVSKGTVDLGYTLTGPGKSNLYTLTAAAAVEKPQEIEKAFRAAMKDLPAEMTKGIQLDALKIQGYSAHKYTISEMPDDGPKRILGEKPVLLIVFGKDAIYVAIGENGEAEIKRAMLIKPTRGHGFNYLTAYGPRAVKLIPVDPGMLPFIEMGERLKDWISVMDVDIYGGKELHIEAKSGIITFFFLAMSAFLG